MLVLKKCCCCIELKSAINAIGVYGILSFILASIDIFCLCSNYNKLVEHLEMIQPRSAVYFLEYKNEILIVVAVALIHSILNCLCSAVLICGVQENNPRKIKLWLYVNVIAITLAVIITPIFFLLTGVSGATLIYLTLSFEAVFLFEMYVALIVWSFYVKVHREETVASYIASHAV